MKCDIYEVPRGQGYVLARSNDGVGFVSVVQGKNSVSPDFELVAQAVEVTPFSGPITWETDGRPVGRFALPSGKVEFCVM